MPPSLLGVLCVVSSALDIAQKAVTIQVGYLARSSAQAPLRSTQSPLVTRNALRSASQSTASSAFASSEAIDTSREPSVFPSRDHEPYDAVRRTSTVHELPRKRRPILDSAAESSVPLLERSIPSIPDTTTSVSAEPNADVDASTDPALPEESPVILKASRVPSSRLGRLFHYGGLAVGLTAGATTQFFRKGNPADASQRSLLLNDANITRLVDKLTMMRGAALKLGQFLSIQDAHILPPQLESVFQQLQNKADYMPNWQMEKVMSEELGSDWKSNFIDFNPIPIASASIGQVHTAKLASTNMPLAIKIQFPNVAQSISSDLSNLSMLLSSTALLPRGLFLGNTIKAMREELAEECNYEREADSIVRFSELLKGDDSFTVPAVLKEQSTKRVLLMERMTGVPLTRAVNFNQSTRNEISTKLLTLCLQELFRFRLMQTDPNWTNFLWNASTRKIELIDFGATREYSKRFMDDWLRLLRAAIAGEKAGCLEASLRLGYLTGEESEAMLEAHFQSMVLVAVPFRSSSPQPYPFAGQTITAQIRALIPVMLRHRLTPPPKETYSLNRKLSGAFLLCTRLGAVVPCHDIWNDITSAYVYD